MRGAYIADAAIVCPECGLRRQHCTCYIRQLVPKEDQTDNKSVKGSMKGDFNDYMAAAVAAGSAGLRDHIFQCV